MARRLIREEGLLVGGSSGAVVSAAIKVAKDLPADKRVVVVLVDSVRNYMTKFLNDDWMLENKFLDQATYDEKYFSQNKYFGEDKTIADLNLPEVKPISSGTTVSEVLKQFGDQKVKCVSISIIKLVACFK